jgi:hypothetical protein
LIQIHTATDSYLSLYALCAHCFMHTALCTARTQRAWIQSPISIYKIVYASDALDMANCMQHCTDLKCTCFDFNGKSAPADNCGQDSFVVPLNDVQVEYSD